MELAAGQGFLVEQIGKGRDIIQLAFVGQEREGKQAAVFITGHAHGFAQIRQGEPGNADALTEKRQAALLPPGAADGKGVLQGGEALGPRGERASWISRSSA